MSTLQSHLKWLDRVTYDLDTAKAMLQTGRLYYRNDSPGFHPVHGRSCKMAMSKDEVIQMAKKFLDQVRGKYDVRDAYLFGSFAKGTPADYSDVDLAIILGGPPGLGESLFDESFMIFHEAQEFNSRLEVVCFPQEEFDQDGGALARQIKKEGIKLL